MPASTPRTMPAITADITPKVIAGQGSSLRDAAAKKTRGLNIASRVVSHHRVKRPRLVSSHGTGPPIGGGLYPGGYPAGCGAKPPEPYAPGGGPYPPPPGGP